MRILQLVLVMLLMWGCRQDQDNGVSKLEFFEKQGYVQGKLMAAIVQNKVTFHDVTAEQWQELSGKKIFFGHQSVGKNIVEGIADILQAHPQLKLTLVNESNPSRSAFFAHSAVGRNKDPQSKTEEFCHFLQAGLGAKVDIAFHKYCYVDVNTASSVETIFAGYKKQMDALVQAYPDVKFIHVTMPLTTIPSGPKAWIKKILGRPSGEVMGNRKRNEYNRLLLATYQRDGLVFDLAAIEASTSDVGFQTFTVDGRPYLCMNPQYSDDGGHLNASGRKIVAEKLLVFLSQIQ